jgi:hypothetical protein
MEFQKQDLLNMKEIRLLIESIFPNEISTTIKNKLTKYCFIKSNGYMYTLQDNISYIETLKTDDIIVTYTTWLLEQSYKNLSADDSERIRDKFPKVWTTIFQNSFVKKILPQLISGLTNDKIVLNGYLDEMHFNNGYYNLKTKEFKPRDITKHFITQFINRDYTQSTKEQRTKLLTIAKDIYPLDADLKAILMELGRTLSGRSPNDQSTLFLLGKGSSGKSFIMSLTGFAIGCYMQELQDDTFAANNANLSKILNTFKDASYIRIAWLNEMKDTKLNDTGFKNFCDGKACTTMLYKDKQYNFNLYCKCVISANHMPAMVINSGVTRRIEAYTHKSEFLKYEERAKVDHSKHKYLKDIELLTKLVEGNLLNAWFDILADHCYASLKGEQIEYTDNFRETKTIVVNTNDIIKDFIDSCLVITNLPTDRIGKNAMLKYFSAANPTKHLSSNQLINSLKEKDIVYDFACRCKARLWVLNLKLMMKLMRKIMKKVLIKGINLLILKKNMKRRLKS